MPLKLNPFRSRDDSESINPEKQKGKNSKDSKIISSKKDKKNNSDNRFKQSINSMLGKDSDYEFLGSIAVKAGNKGVKKVVSKINSKNSNVERKNKSAEKEKKLEQSSKFILDDETPIEETSNAQKVHKLFSETLKHPSRKIDQAYLAALERGQDIPEQELIKLLNNDPLRISQDVLKKMVLSITGVNNPKTWVANAIAPHLDFTLFTDKEINQIASLNPVIFLHILKSTPMRLSESFLIEKLKNTFPHQKRMMELPVSLIDAVIPHIDVAKLSSVEVGQILKLMSVTKCLSSNETLRTILSTHNDLPFQRLGQYLERVALEGPEDQINQIFDYINQAEYPDKKSFMFMLEVLIRQSFHSVFDSKIIYDPLLLKLFIKKAVDSGLDINLRKDFKANESDINYKGTSSIVEHIFYRRDKNPERNQFRKDTFVNLVLEGGIINDSILTLLIAEIKSGQYPNLKEILIEKKLAIPEDFMPRVPHEVSVSSINEKIRLLNAFSSTFNLNYNYVPLDKISEIKQFKKDVKAYLNNPDAVNRDEIIELNNNLSSLYDAFVAKHLFLNELRLVSQEIRSLSRLPVGVKVEPSERLVRLYSVWGPDHQQSYGRTTTLNNIAKIFSESRKEYWTSMYERMTTAAQKSEVTTSILNQRSITWLHGTTSAALPSLLKTQALIPAGIMLSRGIVPMTGEISGSDENINKDHLSGEMLTAHWDDDVNAFYYDASTRFLVNLLYATRTAGVKDHSFQFKPLEAWARIETLSQVSLEDFTYKSGLTRIDILRLRMVDPDATAKLTNFTHHLQDLKSTASPEELEKLKVFEEALTVHLSYYTSEEAAQVLDETPFPVIFASTNITSSPFRDRGDDGKIHTLEYLAAGDQKFGEHIQVAFTTAEHVDELSRRLGNSGIQVFDLDTAFYLETVSMIKGSQNVAMEASSAASLLSSQTKINIILQRDILPQYAIPFPKTVTYKDSSGIIHEVQEPFYGQALDQSYEDYIDSISNGLALPRTIHGAMHATRVAIWTQVLANVMQEVTGRNIEDRFSLAVAAATHDITRKDEAKDYWDADSGDYLESYVTARNLDFKDREAWIQALREKDPVGNKFTTDFQRIIHDADCLEIIRTLKDQDQFRSDELAILNLEGLDPVQTAAIKVKMEAVIQEVASFIAETEPMKMELEQKSQQYYKDVLLLLDNDKYPTLRSLLVNELAAAA